MGDLSALIDKVRSVTGEKESEDMQQRMMDGKLSLDDVISQVKSMNSMGGFDKIKNMIPGMGAAKIPEGAMEAQQDKVAKWEHIVKSLTKAEREDPEVLLKETSRIRRVAAGAGVNSSDVRSLLKQYKMLSDMMKGGMGDIDPEKGFSEKDMKKMMKKFGKIKGMKF